MPEETTEPSSKNETGPITVEELIRSQLLGKSTALGKYDEILWKIRSGYVVIVYGVITVIGGSAPKPVETIGIQASMNVLFYVTLGLSVCALLIDLGFVLAKLRVVDARNSLSDHAVMLATGKEVPGADVQKLIKLLRLSGEAATWPPWALVANGTWSIALLYSLTPALLFVVSRYL